MVSELGVGGDSVGFLCMVVVVTLFKLLQVLNFHLEFFPTCC